jgi:hypothetical protein
MSNELMKINCFNLPTLFLDAISQGWLKRGIGSWSLTQNIDALGNPLETELGEVFDTFERLKKETDELPSGFEINGYYGESAPGLEEPGAIPDIHDFSKIVCFAISGDGSPFCFDYRQSAKNPSVIWWDDVYWRRIAPDFRSFLALFNLERSS